MARAAIQAAISLAFLALVCAAADTYEADSPNSTSDAQVDARFGTINARADLFFSFFPWTSSANRFIAKSWCTIVDMTGGEGEDYFRLCLLPLTAQLLLFWLLNIPLLVWNFVPSISPIERWKIQKGRYETKERVVSMLLVVLLNHTIAVAISASPQNYEVTKASGLLAGKTGIPTIGNLAWQIPTCCMMYDAIFFTVHCAMHTRWLYHNVHKVHHRSKISIGIVSAYFHPVDYVLSAIAVIAPPALVSTHVLTTAVWMLVFMLETTNAHCGYEIPFLPSAKDHDFHHSHSFYSSKKYRFVTMGAFALVWDRLFGTKRPVDEWWAEHPEGIKRGGDAPVEKAWKGD